VGETYTVGWFSLIGEGDFTTVAGSLSHCWICVFIVRESVLLLSLAIVRGSGL
jgi:hypothetical protein